MVFNKSAILGFIIKQLNLYELSSLFIEVNQQVLLVKLKALLIYEQLIMVTHNVLFRLMNVHRLEDHIGRIILGESTLRWTVIVLIFLVGGASELLIESIFEVLADGHLFKFIKLIVKV